MGCRTWHLFVFTIDLTHFSQLHPGSNDLLPMVTLPRFVRSIFPFSNDLVSSGKETRLFSAFIHSFTPVTLLFGDCNCISIRVVGSKCCNKTYPYGNFNAIVCIHRTLIRMDLRKRSEVLRHY